MTDWITQTVPAGTYYTKQGPADTLYIVHRESNGWYWSVMVSGFRSSSYFGPFNGAVAAQADCDVAHKSDVSSDTWYKVAERDNPALKFIVCPHVVGEIKPLHFINLVDEPGKVVTLALCSMCTKILIGTFVKEIFDEHGNKPVNVGG